MYVSFRTSTFSHFSASTVHADELEEFFEHALANDFHIDAQDGSIEEVQFSYNSVLHL